MKNIQEFFSLIAFKKEEWPYSQSELDCLVNRKILYFIEEEGDYLLTYKGLAILEYNLEFSSEFDCYLNDINSLYFEKILGKKYEQLKPKNKVILLTALGLYAYLPDYSLCVDESNKSEFAKSANFAIEILKIQNPKDANELSQIWSPKVIGEDSILSNLRRLDEIPQKTGNIFKTPSGDKHGIYVDLLNKNGSINEYKALFLLKKLFDNKSLDLKQKENLINALNNIETGHFSLIQSNCKMDRIKMKIELRDIILEKL